MNTTNTWFLTKGIALGLFLIVLSILGNIATDTMPETSAVPTMIPTFESAVCQPEDPHFDTVPTTSPLVFALYNPTHHSDTFDLLASPYRPQKPYVSTDPDVITSHIQLALAAKLDGFVVSGWNGKNKQADIVVKTLLAQAAPVTLQITLQFDVAAFNTADISEIIRELRYIQESYFTNISQAQFENKPVLYFAQNDLITIRQWQEVRQSVDPNREAIWLSEADSSDYLGIFDGFYLNTLNADDPERQLGDTATLVKQYNAATGHTALWVGTVMPNTAFHIGHDPNTLNRLRSGGAHYLRLWRAVFATNPNMILINSFNDWQKGTQIEPDQSCNAVFIQLTQAILSKLPAPIQAVASVDTPAAPPTVEPTTLPTAEPTPSPTVEPTALPSAEPTSSPTVEPTALPSAEPTPSPTVKPTALPSAEPTPSPTVEPTALPSAEPTSSPTVKPTLLPAAEPTPTAESTPNWTETSAALPPPSQTPPTPWPTPTATATSIPWPTAQEIVTKTLIVVSEAASSLTVGSSFDCHLFIKRHQSVQALRQQWNHHTGNLPTSIDNEYKRAVSLFNEGGKDLHSICVQEIETGESQIIPALTWSTAKVLFDSTREILQALANTGF